MALKRRHLKDDLAWLKWPLILFVLIAVAATISYVSAIYFRNEMQRQEQQAMSSVDLISAQVREIESSELIIIENIDRFNNMVANSILDEENRVELLEELRTIREKHQLYPISVDIREQERLLLTYASDVESPEEQISLRSSRIQIQLSLLHEEDLMLFLADFLGSGRLMFNSSCSINGLNVAEDALLEFVAHQLATCDFYWYTLRREPYTGI